MSEAAVPALIEPKVERQQLIDRLIHVTWMAALLGLLLEFLTVVLLTLAGRLPEASLYLVSVSQKVTWSTVVCGALAIGSAAAKARGTMMGLAGLLGAPLAFVLARSLQKALAEVLKIETASAALTPLLILAALKAFQYGLLGFLLERASRTAGGGLKTYLLFGAVAGLVFGSASLALFISSAPTMPSAVDLGSRAISEILHPVGCALVLWAAEAIGKKL